MKRRGALGLVLCTLLAGCGLIIGDDAEFMLVGDGGGGDGSASNDIDGSVGGGGKDATVADAGTDSSVVILPDGAPTDANVKDAPVDSAIKDAGVDGSYCANVHPDSGTVILCIDYDESADASIGASSGSGAVLDLTIYRSAPASVLLDAATLDFTTTFADASAVESLSFDTTFNTGAAGVTLFNANFSSFGFVGVTYNGGQITCATGASSASVPLEAGTWHHVIVGLNGGTVYCTVDGATGSLMRSDPTATSKFSLGSTNTTNFIHVDNLLVTSP